MQSIDVESPSESSPTVDAILTEKLTNKLTNKSHEQVTDAGSSFFSDTMFSLF